MDILDSVIGEGLSFWLVNRQKFVHFPDSKTEDRIAMVHAIFLATGCLETEILPAQLIWSDRSGGNSLKFSIVGHSIDGRGGKIKLSITIPGSSVMLLYL